MKMDLRNAGWNDMDCTHLVQEREEWRNLVNTVTNIRTSHNAGKLHEIMYSI
jgi:hypothetical protein